VELVSVKVELLAIPPPSLPDVLPLMVERVIVVPLSTCTPAPRPADVLPLIVESLIVAVPPSTLMPPPPLLPPCALLPLTIELETISVAPFSVWIPPPLPEPLLSELEVLFEITELLMARYRDVIYAATVCRRRVSRNDDIIERQVALVMIAPPKVRPDLYQRRCQR
jgi:hypothetical protein